MDLFRLSALQLSGLMREGEVSSEEVVNSFLQRIEQVEPQVKAFLLLCPEEALAAAREVDRRRLRGDELNFLAGVPVAVKDNICTRGLRTTCASRILENYVPPYDATVVSAIRRAGLPILGKTNMDEFAMGSSTENSAFFSTRNPWDTRRVPGGSSGGSAAAVAAGEAPLALGSDTGGSVRQPAAFCGVTGLRPTYGRVSRYGLIAFASSLDQVGTHSRDAAGGLALFRLIAGHDPLDATSINTPLEEDVEADNFCENGLKGLRLGLISEQMGDGFAPEVKEKIRQTAALLEGEGAFVEEVSLPLTDYALAAYYLINPAEASSNLGRYDGVRYGLSERISGGGVREMFAHTRGKGFGMEVKRRIILGSYALSAGYYDAYYLQALKVRTLIKKEMEKAFERFDVLFGPSTPTTPFMLGEKVDDPLQMYLSDVCNITDALTGNPSLSIPCGLSPAGMPVGMQLSAPPLNEMLLFRVAAAIENMRPLPPLPEQVNILEGGQC